MHSLSLIAVAVLSTLYAVVWDDKPARHLERHPIEPGTFVLRSNKSPHLNWEVLAIWGFVVISFTALFVAGYVIWAKCHGR